MKLSPEAREARREYNRKYREKNRAKINEYHRQWNKAHPDRAKKYTSDYWARQAAAAKGESK